METERIWTPSEERIERSNLNRFLRFAREETGNEDLRRYAPLYDYSIAHPERFWTLVWDFCGVRASGEREPVLVDGERMPGAKWFPNVRLNFAQNLLRYKDDRPALVFRNEWGHRRQYTYAELHAEVGRVAHALREAGVVAGDRVAGFLPNMPETVIAMLAATSLGATWSSCSPDFGINGVVDRFGQIAPKVLFTADAYPYGGKTHDCLDRIRGVLDRIPSIERLVVIPYSGQPLRLQGLRGAVAWPEFADSVEHALEFVPTPFDHPVYIMYSSGTTGAPKCIVHGAGGTLLQHLKELVLHTDLKREDRIFYYTTCGWMMWNWLVSGLAVGATVVLYDGSPFHPDGNVLWDLADEIGISVFGTSAKWIAAIEKAGIRPRETHKLTALKTILSTGSPLAPESFDYVYRDVKERVLLSSISGGTDIISCFALGAPVLPVYRGELQCRGLGMKVEVLDDAGQPVRNAPGELACLAPFPSMPVGFWNDPDGEKYRNAYFARIPNVWCHGDYAELTDRNTVIIYGRSDATLNPGGVRIGTAEIYRQVEQVHEVLESVAVGQKWEGDERVVLFVRLREGLTLDDGLREKIRQQIRANTTPRHVPAKILQVADIPRTISGKISEIAVRDTIHGRTVKNTDALANPQALAHFCNIPDLTV
ncbi:acetoacetyl-CoA synthase [Mizugakiibacter sediminis]|uniref:Acetoacetyl-CoA synthase n=1 Tax=Mizugakiibacter sediminis TaxID=1475481 RepID=A0A0K8QLT8_9GAMM|nr:acetoacetate--CoA ligase [Mizugakiibacter sediminis]GAP65646.1 acetoacetyl-CoA synthase [Mizugakiibacter sediminis]